MAGALINFRKILDINFMLFVFSLVFYLEIYNHFYSNKHSIFVNIKELEFILPFIVSYIFIIVVITPFTKYFLSFLSMIRFFSIFDRIREKFFNQKDSAELSREYVYLHEMKEKSIGDNNSVMYQNYLYHKDEEEKEIFQAKLSFVNIILMIVSYILVEDSLLSLTLALLDTDVIIANVLGMLIMFSLFFLCLSAIKYIEPNSYQVPKREFIFDE